MRLTVYGRYTDFGLMSLGLNVRFTRESGHSAASPRRRCQASAGEQEPWYCNCCRRKYRNRATDRQARVALLPCKQGKISVAVIERP
jgi:hypothetical protein